MINKNDDLFQMAWTTNQNIKWLTKVDVKKQEGLAGPSCFCRHDNWDGTTTFSGESELHEFARTQFVGEQFVGNEW